MTTLWHLSLATGHARRAARTECEDAYVSIAAQQLGEALTLRDAPIRDGYTLRAGATGKALLATVLGEIGGHPAPLATIAVAGSSRASHAAWAELGKPMPLALPTVPWAREPQPPWCAVRLYATIDILPEALSWLGDYERCLAWAWIEGRVKPRPS